MEGLEEESNVGKASCDCPPPVLLLGPMREHFGAQRDVGLTLLKVTQWIKGRVSVLTRSTSQEDLRRMTLRRSLLSMLCITSATLLTW